MLKSLRLRSEESVLCGYLHDGKGITGSLTFRGLPWLDMHFVELLKEQRKRQMVGSGSLSQILVCFSLLSPL